VCINIVAAERERERENREEIEKIADKRMRERN
jgi:hypothetical protein